MPIPEHRSHLAAKSSFLERGKKGTSECQRYMLTKLKHTNKSYGWLQLLRGTSVPHT